MNMVPRHIWEGRAAFLRKARDGKLSFSEFCLVDMHKETKDLINGNTLSDKGLSTLCAIELYLEARA